MMFNRYMYNITSLLSSIWMFGACITSLLSVNTGDSLVIPSTYRSIYPIKLMKSESKTTPITTTTLITISKQVPTIATICLNAIGGSSSRENEIRRKIKSLKKQGYINKDKQSENMFDGMDDDIDDDDNDDEESDTNDNTKVTMTSSSSTGDYTGKIRKKLGPMKSKVLGFNSDNDDTEDAMDNEISKLMRSTGSNKRMPQIGSLSSEISGSTDQKTKEQTNTQKVVNDMSLQTLINSNELEDEDDDDNESIIEERSEEDLLDLVALKLQEKRDRENREKLDKIQSDARERLQQLELERQQQQQQQQKQPEQEQQLQTSGERGTTSTLKQTTSGVGGSWTKQQQQENDIQEDVYQPKIGTWGAFPRPRDISKAYGGGRRVGVGSDDDTQRKRSEDDTREKLKNYRVKMGIDYEQETIHATEIAEALSIASIAMQRGIYSTAVSALEKVTKYCSTNSKVGGKVFLELAMAYEAVGRTKEAITVYSTLSRSRIEKIKMNAKRLLYGIEAMQFMQDTVGSSEFSRKKVTSTFIDTTGLANIASKFDDRYETAYIDLSSKGNYYKKLTESVVRSPREARQILLLATGPGEVDRLKIVQACRSLNRRFDESIQDEIKNNELQQQENVAIMNGKPIVQREESKSILQQRKLLLLQQQQQQQRTSSYNDENDNDDDDDDDSEYDEELEALMSLDEYILKDASKMKSMLHGEWKLQLLADKRGDGVKFYNTSNVWQSITTINNNNSNNMSFTSSGPLTPFLTVQINGNIVFNDKRRIVRRSNIILSGVSSWVTNLLFSDDNTNKFVPSISGPIGSIRNPQQILLIDPILLVTRNVPSIYRQTSSSSSSTATTSKRSVSSNPEDEKDYFAVWRRVDTGTYSVSKQ